MLSCERWFFDSFVLGTPKEKHKPSEDGGSKLQKRWTVGVAVWLGETCEFDSEARCSSS